MAITTLVAEGWGVISYHFAGKDELMKAIVEGVVYTGIGERVVPKLDGLDRWRRSAPPSGR